MFPPQINNKLEYEEDIENLVILVRFKRNLRSDFTRVAEVIREYGGEYVSSWRNPHFRVAYSPPREEEANKLEVAGRYEEAAQIYEMLGMLEKAGEARRKERTQYLISTNFQIGNDGTIKIQCPYCSASKPAESKSSEVTCTYCGRTYVVPKKILDMI